MMEPQQITLLLEIAIESAIYALILFSLVALVVGIALLLAPQKVERLRAISDHWLTPRRSFKPLEIPHQSDPFLYHNHQWIGTIAIIVPLITLYLLLYTVAEELPRSEVARPEHYLFWAWLYESATLLLWISNIFALLVGIVIFFRPSLLKRVEGGANRWLSTRQGMRQIDKSYHQLDEAMSQHARVTAIFLIIGALYILLMMVTFVLQHPSSSRRTLSPALHKAYSGSEKIVFAQIWAG